jgi:two-component system sensor histidine kinase/response regulator
MDKTRILIVEDENIIAMDLRGRLSGLGYDVPPPIPTGEEAVQQAAAIHPQLVLMDMVLKGQLDGVQAAAEIHAKLDIPVIYLTAYSDEHTFQRAKITEPYGYVLKPFEDRELYTAIEMALHRHRMEQQLRRRNVELAALNDELQARNAELDAFAHTVAHDLKNPLGLAVGHAELLAEDGDRLGVEERAHSVAEILQNCHKMDNIIDELLLLSEVRKAEVTLQQVDMEVVVAEAQRRLAHLVQVQGAVFVLPTTWPSALGYAPWVEEVWVNYLSNAIKYGGRADLHPPLPPRAEIGATVQPDGMVCYWVRDNGKGLTPEEQARLFVPFTRLEQARARGHGLGLSIVRRIVEKLGGSVSVNSRLGEGSIFGFTLPAAPS